jgi:hypothetical protein
MSTAGLGPKTERESGREPEGEVELVAVVAVIVANWDDSLVHSSGQLLLLGHEAVDSTCLGVVGTHDDCSAPQGVAVAED